MKNKYKPNKRYSKNSRDYRAILARSKAVPINSTRSFENNYQKPKALMNLKYTQSVDLSRTLSKSNLMP